MHFAVLHFFLLFIGNAMRNAALQEIKDAQSNVFIPHLHQYTTNNNNTHYTILLMLTFTLNILKLQTSTVPTINIIALGDFLGLGVI